jgi:acyl-CoA dehydrogenase
MMQFEISPEQKQLKETARRFAADEIIPIAARCDEEQTFAEDVVRKAWVLQIYEGTSQIQRVVIPRHLLKG